MGCGHGDILRDVATFGRKKGYQFKLIGIDANPDAIAYANELSIDYPELSFEVIDIFSEAFQKLEYDVALCTLFTHHFKDEELISFLKPTVKRAKTGMVINDLHRHRLAYYLFKLIGLFIKNKMVREDGLTSILRAFKRKDLEHISTKLKSIFPLHGNGHFVINGLYKIHECKNNNSSKAATSIYERNQRHYSFCQTLDVWARRALSTKSGKAIRRSRSRQTIFNNGRRRCFF